MNTIFPKTVSKKCLFFRWRLKYSSPNISTKFLYFPSFVELKESAKTLCWYLVFSILVSNEKSHLCWHFQWKEQMSTLQNALLSAIPFLANWLFSIFYSRALDFLVGKKIIKTVHARKTSMAIGKLVIEFKSVSFLTHQSLWAGRAIDNSLTLI